MKFAGKVALSVLVMLLFLSACRKVNSGIQGKVVLAYCTGADIATDCTPRSTYAASLTIYNDKMVVLGTYKTKGDGTFLIPLKPGTYYVHPEPEVRGSFPMASDFKVVVDQGKIPEMTIYYDMGQRPVPTPSNP